MTGMIGVVLLIQLLLRGLNHCPRHTVEKVQDLLVPTMVGMLRRSDPDRRSIIMRLRRTDIGEVAISPALCQESGWNMEWTDAAASIKIMLEKLPGIRKTYNILRTSRSITIPFRLVTRTRISSDIAGHSIEPINRKLSNAACPHKNKRQSPLRTSANQSPGPHTSPFANSLPIRSASSTLSSITQHQNNQ